MQSVPTYRQGRTYFQFGPNDRGGCAGICSILIVLTLLTLPPLLLIASESVRHDTYTALMEVLKEDIVEVGSASKTIHAGDMVHAMSDHVTSEPGASDPEMAITLSNALLLKRRTEYCQWQELQTETCQTCTRQVRAKDGSTQDEDYSCHCVISFSYVKSWRPHRIQSALFDQPGAHNNPMRDPLPSTDFVAPTATLRLGGGDDNDDDKRRTTKRRWWTKVWRYNTASIEEITMDDTMIRHTRSAWRNVKWTSTGRADEHGFFRRMLPSWWPKDNARFESTESLKEAAHSPAATHHHFVYAGNGYFYSPYEASTSATIFKYFQEYVEGSLMDWQVGDVIPSCTAGDVRVYYQVADPTVVSVVGEVMQRKQQSVHLTPRTTTNGLEVGMIHAGIWTVEEMVAREDSDAWWTAIVFRVVAFVWSAVVYRLFGALAGKDVSGSSIETRIIATVAVWCVVMGSVWTGIWESDDHNSILTAFGIAIFIICLLWYTPGADSPPGLRAVWCKIGRWARVPPSWRMEASYPNESPKRKRE